MKYIYTTQKNEETGTWYLIQNEQVIGLKNYYVFNNIIYADNNLEKIIEKLQELNKKESVKI